MPSLESIYKFSVGVWIAFVALVLYLIITCTLRYYFPDAKDRLMVRLAADGVLQVDERGKFLYKGQVIE